MACRPDYLLYPQYIENNRAERVQLMGVDFKPLAAIQDYYNTFKNKRIEISDKYLWCAETKDIIEAFNKFIDKSKHNSRKVSIRHINSKSHQNEAKTDILHALDSLETILKKEHTDEETD